MLDLCRRQAEDFSRERGFSPGVTYNLLCLLVAQSCDRYYIWCVDIATRAILDTEDPSAMKLLRNIEEAFARAGISLDRATRTEKGLQRYGRELGIDSREVLRELMSGMVEQILSETKSPQDFGLMPNKVARLLGRTLYAMFKMSKSEKSRTSPLNEEIVAHGKDEKNERKAFVEGIERAMINAVPTLTQPQWTVYWLNVVEDMTLQEIAERMHIAPGTAASHLARAKVKIKNGAFAK
jgi:hypothetical protein